MSSVFNTQAPGWYVNLYTECWFLSKSWPITTYIYFKLFKTFDSNHDTEIHLWLKYFIKIQS
jgi:hypothetical protein